MEHTYGQLEKILDMLKRCPDSDPFMHPVKPSDVPEVAFTGHVREIDQIAYVRFASVYRQFRDVTEFIDEAKQSPDEVAPLYLLDDITLLAKTCGEPNAYCQALDERQGCVRFTLTEHSIRGEAVSLDGTVIDTWSQRLNR